MVARLATFNAAPADIDDANVELLRQTIKSTPGFVAGFHLGDESTGAAYSLIVFEDATAAAAAREALAAPAPEDRVGVDPTACNS